MGIKIAEYFYLKLSAKLFFYKPIRKMWGGSEKETKKLSELYGKLSHI